MARTSERLKRYLADDAGECREADVERRLAELASFDGNDDRRAEDVEALSAVADETRYRLARALHAADGELCVCELVALVDVSDSAVSHALSTLVEAGVATRRKAGRWRMYRITSRGTALLVALDGTRH